MPKKEKTPWPTKDAMQQVYEMKLWGGKEYDYYSGVGSHDLAIVNPYLKAVISFLKGHNNALTVCDLGCGDFNVGKHLMPFAQEYIAVDIVKNLIDRNKIKFKSINLRFECMDIVEDELPIGDCAILRQVLQHLSNTEIQKITKKLNHYKYVILTEHVPMGNFISNKTLISGQGIRLKQNSGVDLLAEPFNLRIAGEQNLEEAILRNNKGRIVTTLYTLF